VEGFNIQLRDSTIIFNWTTFLQPAVCMGLHTACTCTWK